MDTRKFPSYLTRRRFIKLSGMTTICMVASPYVTKTLDFKKSEYPFLVGPASLYKPSVRVAFIRREEEYGMRWPGQIYDGKAAFDMYHNKITETASDLGISLDMLPQPIYSLEEGEKWISESMNKNPDGLMLVALDRQEHTWPTIGKAIDTGKPTVVFSPLGTSFTTNTGSLSHKKGVFICSTDDFSQAAFGMKMIKAGARLREMRYLVIMNTEKRDVEILPFGTKLRYLPAQEYIDVYHNIPVNAKVKDLASYYANHATEIHGATIEDIHNGIRSYLAALQLLEKENADAITMDCLGVLGPLEDSLPCLAWSKLNDECIPAACEADLGACITHAMVQYLFDKPGFQQDPVAETSQLCLIGSHCSCPTRLNGFDRDPEPFSIVHHHGVRDATAKPLWKIGQRITVADIVISGEWILRDSERITGQPKMYISVGEVVDNKSIPPSGGCVVAPMVRLDNVDELLDYPGFHQIFFYGDHKYDLKYFCQMYGIEAVVI